MARPHTNIFDGVNLVFTGSLVDKGAHIGYYRAMEGDEVYLSRGGVIWARDKVVDFPFISAQLDQYAFARRCVEPLMASWRAYHESNLWC